MIALRRPPELASHAEGATIVEFALVAPVLLLVIMGLSELCYQGYAASILSGAMQKAGRDSTLESGTANNATIDAAVLSSVRMIAGTATAEATRKSYSTFGNIKPEDYSDTNKNGKHDAGECYTDVNGNKNWDEDPGLEGQGGADDIVVYKVTVEYPRLFPLARMMGWPAKNQISAQTILKNQPYNTQNVPSPATVCN